MIRIGQGYVGCMNRSARRAAWLSCSKATMAQKTRKPDMNTAWLAGHGSIGTAHSIHCRMS